MKTDKAKFAAYDGKRRTSSHHSLRNFNTRPLQCNDKEKGMRPKVKQFDYRVFSDAVKFGFRWLKFFQRNLQSR